MPAFIKHVGRNQNGTRLVVVFREIPDDEEHCLVVETDSLPDMYHDQLLHEVNSKEAQDTVDLFDVLARRSFGDGGQMLNTLHTRGMLRKYRVEQIEMQPMPNRIVPLNLVNEQIKTGAMESEASATEEEKAGSASSVANDAKDTGVSVDTAANLVKTEVKQVVVGEVDVTAQKVEAESKLLQARLMEEDAKKMREQAYSLDPGLKKGGRPKKAKAETKKD